MELVETLNLGGKRQLMLVICDGHRVLLGSGGDAILSVIEIKDTTDVIQDYCASRIAKDSQDLSQGARCC
jgi:hypothetical protein